MRRRNGRGPILVLSFAVAAAIVFTYPLIRHSTDAIPFGTRIPPERSGHSIVPGDHLQFYYFLAVARDMATGRVPLLRDPYQFHAPESDRRGGYFFFPFSLLFTLASPLGGAMAYNLLVWFSFPATALSVFLLARRVGLDDGGAGIAAAIVTLLPYRVANVAVGHPSGLVFFLLPLAFYFLDRGWHTRGRGAAAAAGLCMVFLGVNEPHFVYFFAFLLPLWGVSLLWRLGETERPREVARSLAWIALAAAGPAAAYATWRGADAGWGTGSLLGLWACASALLAGVWRLTAEARARTGDAAWLDEARSYLPLVLLVGYAARAVFPVPYLGRGLLVVTFAALFVAKRKLWRDLGRLAGGPTIREVGARSWALWPAALGFLVMVGLVFLYKFSFVDQSAAGAGRDLREVRLFSARPADFLQRANPILTHYLYPGGVAVALALFALRVRRARAVAAATLVFAVVALGAGAPEWVPLYPLAFEAVPYFDRIRQAAKFFFIAATALGLTAGFGAMWLRSRLGSRGGAALIALAVAGVAADFSAVLPLGVSLLPRHNDVYAEVARRAHGSNLLELPVWPGDSHYSSIYQYWATVTRVPIVNGYSPTVSLGYVETVARPLETMNSGEMTAEQYRLLRDLRVRFVTLHGDAFPTKVSAYPYRFTLATMKANPNLELVAEDGGVHLFALREDGYRPWDADRPWPDGAFFEAEHLRIGAGRREAAEEASGGTVVRGTDEGPGRPVLYGPYLPFPAGGYEAWFRIRGTGRLEVAADRGETVLAAASVKGDGFRDVPLAFVLDRVRKLELRAWGDGGLEIDRVFVRKLGAETARFEAENLRVRAGGVRETAEGSGEALAWIAPATAPAGSVALEGPYRILEGPSRVRVRARGGRFVVRVESADGRRSFAELGVRPTDSWRTTGRRIVLPGREVVRVSIVSGGEAAEVDFVELGPVP